MRSSRRRAAYGSDVATQHCLTQAQSALNEAKRPLKRPPLERGPMASSRRVLTSAIALVAAGLAGAALALGGAALLFGHGSGTTTVRELVNPGNSPAAFG